MNLDKAIEVFWTVVLGFLLVQYVGIPTSDYVKELITQKSVKKELVLR